MKITDFVPDFVPTMDSPEKVYDLFRGLGYPAEKILDPSYRRKISEFDLAKDEREKVKNIYTVLNYDGKLQIFLIEVKTLSTPLIKYLTKRFSDIYEKFLLLLTADYREYSFVFPDFERIEAGKHRLKLTRLVFDRENPYHTDLLTITGLALTGEEESHRDVWRRWKEAFRVEKVTDNFFEDYKKAFFRLRENFRGQKIPVKEAHELAQQFLNRLMFLYFIAKKKWLNADTRFIRWYWERYKKERRESRAKKDTFYDDWLRILFLEAFNNRYSHPAGHPKDVKDVLAMAPYLNGGLFRSGDLDNLNCRITDGLFEEVFNFLERYNFTIREELPLDVEVAVDPQMIGYVYESLSNVAEEIYERQDLGIFYTPVVEVNFMCRRSVVEYLAGRLTELPREKVYRLLFDEDKKEVEEYITNKKLWYRLEEVLDNLAVVDPACGSGAFLVGMLHVLVELYKITYRHMEREMTEFELKKNIIGTSLYGVDVMPWAVHSAELRLWLQLIIEEDIPYEDRKLFPLLPNLNMRLRVGDSLVQEVGGVNLHIRDSRLSSRIKRKLTSIKSEKEKFYHNDPSAKFKTTDALLREELRVFGELLDDRVFTLKKEIQALEGKKREEQLELISGARKKVPEQKAVFEGLIKEKEEEIERIAGLKRKIQAPGQKPFVWDIDFAEIFGDKGGFDIVIGNPPYVRQEKIAPPNKLKAEVTLEDKREYKEKLLRSIQAHFPFIKKLDRKSDYYIYFYFHGLSLLNEKGTFCFITSNSWLDVGYGRDLQEFLLKYCPVKAVYDNECKRSFKHADVNTVIVLFGAPDTGGAPGRWPALGETARFVMFKKPFEEVVNTKNLLEMEGAVKIKKTDAYRIYPIKQEALLEEGWEQPEEERVGAEEKTATSRSKAAKQSRTLLKGRFESGRYGGDKWGGKYLRAPDIFFTILEKGKGKLVRLGDIAEVRRGFTTGCNEFFYLPSKHFDIRKDGKYYELIPKHEGLPKGIRIEEEYLRPVIISPRDSETVLIRPKKLKRFALICHEDKKNLGRKLIFAYINWGEEQNFHKRPSCKIRKYWWDLGDRIFGEVLWPMAHNERQTVFLSSHEIVVDHNLFEILTEDRDLVWASLMTTYQIMIRELFGRANLGQGALKTEGVDIKKFFVLHPNFFSKEHLSLIKGTIKAFNLRNIESCYIELGTDPTRPIREQTPKPLPDRKALDDVVFDILGLTEEERREVYWSVCELVKNRLDKARSV